MISYKKAAVAADTPMCSEVGKDILLKGGNAVDASLATLICSGLASPQSMGIGGGCYMTIYNRKNGFATTIDARETAPAKANADMFAANNGDLAKGPLSIAVPGEIKGYGYVHKKYGRLKWSDLFDPSIKLAEKGFSVPRALHMALSEAKDLIVAEASLRAVFWNEKSNDVFKEGEKIIMPQMAETLKTISKEGPDTFYSGSLAERILEDCKDIGSIISREDLQNYEVKEKKPLEVTFMNGLKMFTPTAPSGGPLLSFMLKVLDGFKFTPTDLNTIENKTKTYNKILQTFKHTYRHCEGLGDAGIKDVLSKLTSKDYCDSVRANIPEFEPCLGQSPPVDLPRSSSSTSHVSVIDEDGNAVSVTSTINSRFGSERRGMRTGIIFNNEMDDFSVPNFKKGMCHSGVNFIAPGRRPLSSMCPAIIVDPSGDVTKILGAAGGCKITSTTAWVAAHVLWLGQTIDQAVDMPRLHYDVHKSEVQHEKEFDQTILNSLKSLGYRIKDESEPSPFTVVQAIDVVKCKPKKNGGPGTSQIAKKVVQAKSDPRKGGQPDGY